MTEREEKPKEGFFQKVKHLFKHDKKDERDYMDENTIGGQNKDVEVSRPIPIGVTYPNPSNQSNIKEEHHSNQPKTTGETGSEEYVHHIGKSKEPQDSSLIKEDQKDSNFLKEHQNKELKPKEVITTVKKVKKFDEPRQKEKEKYKEGEHQMKQPKQKKEKEVIKSVKIDENESNLEKRDKHRDYDKESLKQKPKEVDLITTVKKVSKFDEGTDEYKKGEMNSTPKEVITTVEKEIIYGKKKEGEYPREELKETKPIHKDSDLDNENERDRNMEGQTNNLQNPQIIQSKDENVIVIPEKRDNVIIIQETRNENVNVLPGQHQNISTFQEPRNQNLQPLTNNGLITQPASDTQLGDISGNKGETVIKIVEKQIGNDKDIHIYLDDKKNESQGLNTGNF